MWRECFCRFQTHSHSLSTPGPKILPVIKLWTHTLSLPWVPESTILCRFQALFVLCVALLECVKFLPCDENASVAVNKVRSRHSATKNSLSLSSLHTTIHITLKRKDKNKFTLPTSQIPTTQATNLSWPLFRKWWCVSPEADWVCYSSVIFVDFIFWLFPLYIEARPWVAMRWERGEEGRIFG